MIVLTVIGEKPGPVDRQIEIRPSFCRPDRLLFQKHGLPYLLVREPSRLFSPLIVYLCHLRVLMAALHPGDPKRRPACALDSAVEAGS